MDQQLFLVDKFDKNFLQTFEAQALEPAQLLLVDKFYVQSLERHL